LRARPSTLDTRLSFFFPQSPRTHGPPVFQPSTIFCFLLSFSHCCGPSKKPCFFCPIFRTKEELPFFPAVYFFQGLRPPWPATGPYFLQESPYRLHCIDFRYRQFFACLGTVCTPRLQFLDFFFFFFRHFAFFVFSFLSFSPHSLHWLSFSFRHIGSSSTFFFRGSPCPSVCITSIFPQAPPFVALIS